MAALFAFFAFHLSVDVRCAIYLNVSRPSWAHLLAKPITLGRFLLYGNGRHICWRLLWGEPDCRTGILVFPWN